MKRLGFFLSVFSIGLVIFLVVTGQLTKVFQGSDGATVEVPEKKHFEIPTRNRVVYHNTDLDKGRKRFTLTGDIEQSISLSSDAMRGAKTFHNAVIDVPLEVVAGDGESVNKKPHHLQLRASEVLFMPERKLVRIERDFTGEGTDGTHFETSQVELRFEENKQLSLVGNKPIQFSYTRMRLHGQGGFEAVIDDTPRAADAQAPAGLERMTINPPVVVAVDRNFMGFGQATGATDESGDDRIFIVSENSPLTIDRLTGQALFPGKVKVYRAPLKTDAPLFPAPKSAGTHLTCDELKLTFATDTMQLTSAEARRGKDWPITAQLATDYTLIGNRLTWDDSAAEARLIGDLRIVGPIGVFEAEEARLYPHEHHLVLDQKVRARLNNDPWKMTADRVEIDYDPSADRRERGPRAQIRRLVASGTGPEGIEIQEDRPNGARLLGATLTYQQETDALQVAGDPAWPQLRPSFQEGANKLEADRIELSLADRRLRFVGGVDSRIDLVRRNDQGELESWFPSGKKGEYVDVRAEMLTLEWDSEKSLHRVVVGRGQTAKPVRFRSVAAAERTFEVHGDQIVWLRERAVKGQAVPPSRFVVHGTPAMLSTPDASLAAREIQFNSETYVANAKEEVRLAASQSLIEGGESKPGNVTIECHVLEARFRATTEQSDRVLLSAQAQGRSEEPLVITNGAFKAAGDELAWSASDQLLRLEGEHGSRQKLMRVGPNANDELTAKRITVHSVDLTVEFEGEVRGTLYQADPTPESKKVTDGPVPWQMEAGAATVSLVPSKPMPAESKVAKKDSGGDRSQLLIREALLSGGVTLRNESLAMNFRGTSCQWRHSDQRLRIFSQDGMQWQTLTRGSDPRDQISAREISVVRVPAVQDTPQHLNVLFEDVTEAVFHHRSDDRKNKSKQVNVPGSFRLSQADRLMLIFAEQKDGQHALREVLAWGGIHLRGGEYQVIAQRAVYRQADETLVFHGESDRPVRIEGARNTQRGRVITLKRSRGGYTIEKRGRYPWRSSEIKKFLEEHQREKDGK